MFGTVAHLATMAFAQLEVGGADGFPRGAIACVFVVFVAARFCGAYASARGSGSLRLRQTLVAVGSIGTNLVWGTMTAAVELRTGASTESIVMAFIICAVATGAVGAFAPSRLLRGVALAVLLLPVVILGIWGHGMGSFAVMHAMFFAYLMAQGKLAHRDYWRAVRTAEMLRDHAASAQLAATTAGAMTQRLRDTQAQLVEASRLAGRSDAATAVLHNVGNVLNSVNVSILMVEEILDHSRTAGLSKIATMIAEHRDDLGRFFRDDHRGQRLPDYFAQLPATLERDDDEIRGELKSLLRNLAHINVIVSSQQSHVQPGTAVETFEVGDLLDDALRFSAASWDDDAIEVVRRFDAFPPARLDRHKALQILTNLLANAHDAVMTTSPGARRVTVSARRGAPGNVEVVVEDNGCGVDPQNLDRIFQLGFTTKSTGRGLGLHYSACAARELNGDLTVRSAGVGAGAAFMLVLPLDALAAA